MPPHGFIPSLKRAYQHQPLKSAFRCVREMKHYCSSEKKHLSPNSWSSKYLQISLNISSTFTQSLLNLPASFPTRRPLSKAVCLAWYRGRERKTEVKCQRQRKLSLGRGNGWSRGPQEQQNKGCLNMDSQSKCLLVQDPFLEKVQGMAKLESFLALHYEHRPRCGRKSQDPEEGKLDNRYCADDHPNVLTTQMIT